MDKSKKKELKLIGTEVLEGLNLSSKILFGTALVLNLINERYVIVGISVAGLILCKHNDKTIDDLKTQIRWKI